MKTTESKIQRLFVYGTLGPGRPNEHILGSITREAMAITTALYWDLGESPPPAK